MQDTRWGIIYCPKIGQRHSHKHWERIRECIEAKGLEYDFVQSESADSTERLARMLAQNGYRKIVIVGGDSALCRALNGALAVGNDVELGIVPYGFGNDFARYWGFQEDEYRRAIDWIAQGRTRLVDVGYVETSDGARRYFLNCANIGLASDIIAIQRTSRRWGVLRYFNRSLRILFRRKQSHVKLAIGPDRIDRKVMNVCIGSCRGYGQTPNAVPYSGLLDICVLDAPGLKKLGQGLWLMASGRFLNFDGAEMHRTRNVIKIEDTGGAHVSLDGLAMPEADGKALSIGLLPEHIRFIIPPSNY